MNDENNNVYEAIISLKSQIKFFQSLLQHVRGANEVFKARAMWATWCLHRYLNNELANDIEKAMREFGNKDELKDLENAKGKNN